MKIFDPVEKFAGYGFNKSHSAAYALVYQTPWLKGALSGRVYGGGDDRRYGQHREGRRPVDERWRIDRKIRRRILLTRLLYHFHVLMMRAKIVHGIGAIKRRRRRADEATIDARNQGGYFRELLDLCATDTKSSTAGCWKS